MCEKEGGRERKRESVRKREGEREKERECEIEGEREVEYVYQLSRIVIFKRNDRCLGTFKLSSYKEKA